MSDHDALIAELDRLLTAPAAMNLVRTDLDALISYCLSIGAIGNLNANFVRDGRSLIHYPEVPTLHHQTRRVFDAMSGEEWMEAWNQLRMLTGPLTMPEPSNSKYHSHLSDVAVECVSVLERWALSLDRAIQQTEPRDETREAQIAKLEKRFRLAILSADHAVATSEDDLSTDEAIWRWLDLHGDKSYDLPSLQTFTNYLSQARKALGESKNTPRAGRGGRSIPKQSRL